MSDFVTRSTRPHRRKTVPGFAVIEVSRGHELAISGELNVNTISQAREALAAAIRNGDGELRLQMADAEVADAAGLGVLVAAHERAKTAGRCIVFRDVSQRLDRVIRATKLSRVLIWTPAEAEACAV